MISILCPSRGRPNLAKKMVDTALSTAKGPIQILIYLNDDDPKLQEYINTIDNKFLIVGPDRSPVYSWNKLAELAVFDILMLQGDDAWFETEHWDEKVANVFNQYPDKIVFAYPNLNGYEWRGGKLTEDHCPHFFVHKNWVRALGYFVPPHFWHWYVDTWYRDISKLINRRHIMNDVKIPLLVDFEDATDSRKDRLSNRERDHWLWQHTNRRWLHSDAAALVQFINIYAQNKGQT